MHDSKRIVRAASRLVLALLCATSLSHAQSVGPTTVDKDQKRPGPAAPRKVIDPSVAQPLARLPIRLACTREAPTEFPDQYYGILVTNRGPHTIAAGSQLRWDIGGPQPQGGVFTLAAALLAGGSVYPTEVATRSDGPSTCSVRLAS